MERIISDFNKKVKILTPDDESHYFFGYYDLRATQGNAHLAHRVKFMDRLPGENDTAELGYLIDNKFYAFASTTAWNFQQGSMLEFHPVRKNCVFYNAFLNGDAKTVIHNITTGEKQYADMPTACHSHDGRYGLSVNFGRIFDFRPGYGYKAAKDLNSQVSAPKDDGIFLIDFATGKSRLLISYSDMLLPCGFTHEHKILVNHITFAPDSKSYVFLLRNFDKGGSWSTSMAIGDLDGNIKAVLKNTYVSHYYFINNKVILAHMSVRGEKKGLYTLNLFDGSVTEYQADYLSGKGNRDIHCVLSPDGKYIIGDGYPIDNYRSIVGINTATGANKVILKALTNVPSSNDIRCDLHNRFVFDGKYISFDTVHNGKRQIAAFPSSVLDF